MNKIKVDKEIKEQHTSIHTPTHPYTHTRTHIYIHTHIHTYTHTLTNTHTYIHTPKTTEEPAPYQNEPEKAAERERNGYVQVGHILTGSQSPPFAWSAVEGLSLGVLFLPTSTTVSTPC